MSAVQRAECYIEIRPKYPVAYGYRIPALAEVGVDSRTPLGTQNKTFSITSEINDALSEISQVGILISDYKLVRDYLIEYFDMVDILQEACRSAKNHLGERAQLSLEVYRDPEIKDEYLTLYVRQEHYDEDIMETILKISEEYENELVSKSGWFLVTTDFNPPKHI